jgi:hypothetical protein
MGNTRSAAESLVPAIVLISALISSGGALAQTATDASEGKRVQVLQIREASGPKDNSVKKSKSVATPAKKKAALRNTIKKSGAAANEQAPIEPSNQNTAVQSPIVAAANATPAQNETSAPSSEQTGTLAVGNRVEALASSLGDDNNLGLSTPNFSGTTENPITNGNVVGNSPPAIADANRASIAEIAAGQPESLEGSSPSATSQVLATLTGATLAAAFGCYLLVSSRRRVAFG